MPVNTPSWAENTAEKNRKKKERRQKARERTEERRRSEINAARNQGREQGLSREQIRANMDSIINGHAAEDWDKEQAHRHRMYDYHHGAGAQRRGIAEMEQHARRRQRDLDYIDRVNSGEVEYTGNNLEGDVKSGRHWSQGALDAYDYYQDNMLDIKRGNTDFYYNDYVPKSGRNTGPDGQRQQPKRPTYEQYMGQYYDPDYGKPTYGNPHRGGGGRPKFDGGFRRNPGQGASRNSVVDKDFGRNSGGSSFKDLPEDYRGGNNRIGAW